MPTDRHYLPWDGAGRHPACVPKQTEGYVDVITREGINLIGAVAADLGWAWQEDMPHNDIVAWRPHHILHSWEDWKAGRRPRVRVPATTSGADRKPHIRVCLRASKADVLARVQALLEACAAEGATGSTRRRFGTGGICANAFPPSTLDPREHDDDERVIRDQFACGGSLSRRPPPKNNRER